MSKLSFALLSVYLIVVTALVADIDLLAVGGPMTIRISSILMAGGCCNE